MKICKFYNCIRKHSTKWYCGMHYANWKKWKPIHYVKPIRQWFLNNNWYYSIPLWKDAKDWYAIVDVCNKYLEEKNRRKSMNWYAITSGKNRKHKGIHQLILWEKEWYIIDHINRDKLDNRLDNLRHVTYSVNNLNKSKLTSNTAGHPWIYFNRSSKKWDARYMYRWRVKTIKSCITKEEAIDARKNRELKYGFNPEIDPNSFIL